MATPMSESAGPTAPDDLPDTSLFWRWVAAATRPVIGWVLVGIGVLIIVIGYVGVAHQALVAKQLPYLISGGIGGIAFVAVGTFFLGTEEIRRDSGRLDRLERMVAELHAVLLSSVATAAGPTGASAAGPAMELPTPFSAEAPATSGANGHGATTARAGRLMVLPDGERYHRAGCRALTGKAGAAVASPSVIRRRHLTPCPLCEPSLAEA